MANVNNVLEYAPPLIEEFPNQRAQLKIFRLRLSFKSTDTLDLFRVYAQPYNYTPDASHLGVPCFNDPGPDDLPSRNSAKEVFDQILKDLHDAEVFFGDAPMQNKYHASKEAVWGYSAGFISIWRIGTMLFCIHQK